MLNLRDHLQSPLCWAISLICSLSAASALAAQENSLDNQTAPRALLIENTDAAVREHSAISGGPDQDETRPISVTGEVPVRVNLTTFRNAALSLAADANNGRRSSTRQLISLPLVDGTTVNAVVTESHVTANGSTMMSGIIQGDPASSADFLLSPNGLLTGAIEFTSAGGETHSYRTRRRADGVQVFERFELDLSRSDDDGRQLLSATDEDVRRSLALARKQRIINAAPAGDFRSQSSRAATDSGVVDLMVMYSSNAISRFGGNAATKAAIQFAVEKTNRGWRRSGIKTRLRLVHSGRLTGYPDSGLVDINGIANNGDGFVDYLHTLRRRMGADLVMIIGNSMRLSSGSSICGLGYYPNTLDPLGDIVGFSYVATDCVVGALTFSHEIGHNLGARHDRDTDGYTGSRYSNFGYITASKSYRTVMAYSAPCGTSICPRLNFWSNPNVRFNGERLGLATPVNRSANNARELNRNTARVARYRDEKIQQKPAISAPRNNTWINSANAIVYFSANGTANITGWRVLAGSRIGARNYYDSGVLPAGLRQLKLNRLPSDGTRVHVTLQYRVGASWRRAPHVFRSLRASAVTILDEIQPLREYIDALPSYIFNSGTDQAYLVNRLNALERAAMTDNVPLMTAVEKQIRQRVNGCGTSPDLDDYVFSCRAQKEIQVYTRTIVVALRRL